MIKEYLKNVNQINESALCNELRQYALENDVPIINPEGKVFLKQIAKLSNVKKVLEIGTAIGYSAISMAEVGIEVTSIEINKNTYDVARENVRRSGLGDKIRLIQGDALELDLRVLDDEYDLIFIDAAKAQYAKFFEKYEILLRKGGIIFIDNLLFHELVVSSIENKNLRQLAGKIKNFNDWVTKKEGYDSYIYEIGDGICISIKEA